MAVRRGRSKPELPVTGIVGDRALKAGYTWTGDPDAVRTGRLDNQPFRELCEKTIREQDITWSTLAQRAGYSHARAGDTSALRRAVGVLPESDQRTRQGKRAFRRKISYELAVKIVKACDAYPVDYGV